MTTDTRGPILRLISPTLRAIVTAGVLTLAPQAAFAQDNTNADAPAQAQPAPPDPDTVVATVGSEKITERDLNFAAEDLQQQLRQMPAAGRKAFLVSVLIDMKIMAGAARAEDLQDTDEFRNRMNYLEEQTLRRTYFEKEITSKISEDKTRAAYDKMVAAFQPQEEVHARHILVKDKQTADTVEKELKDGKPFEVAAMENSIDTGSARNGGDLGYFHKGQMVPEFEKAAFSLDVGEISDPVKSQFGWHIIKVEDRRKSSPPPMDQVKAQLQQQVLIQAFDAKMKQLRAGVNVDIPDPALAEAVQKQEEASGASNGQ